MDNENVFALATQLGQALKDDPVMQTMNEAKKAYDEDPSLQQKILEYEAQQQALQAEVAKEDRDTHFIDVVQARIDTLYNEIVSHPVYIQLNAAQAQVNDLMNRVNATITFNITGEMPSCTHDCSTCGGGCH